MRSPRRVINADHTTSPMRPMTWVRGSSSERAVYLKPVRSLHSACPPMKSMPCFLRSAADFAGSNSEVHPGIETIPFLAERARDSDVVGSWFFFF